MNVLLVLSTALIVAGCSGSGRGGVATDTGDLTPTEFSRFALANQIQSTTLRAVDVAIRTKSGGASASEAAKVEGLGLGDALCPVRQTSGIVGGAGRDWTYRRLVTGTGACPIQFIETWSFDRATQTLTFDQVLQATSGDFARQTNVKGRHAQGHFLRTAAPGRTTFNGNVTIEQAHVEDQEGLYATIELEHTFVGSRERGATTLTVNRGRRRVRGVIRHTTREQASDVEYVVNNRPITRQGFERLFSGYGISEIMAKLTNLR